MIEAPRRCVFCASMNPGEDYVRDQTGARRFWPVKVRDINISQFAKDRDALLGEAVQAYRDGEVWYPARDNEELNAQIQDTQGARQVSDPWADIVLNLASACSEMTTEQALSALQIPVERRDYSAAKRVGNLLRAHGYEKKKKRNPLFSGTDDRQPEQHYVWVKA